MTVKHRASLGKEWVKFLALFAGCFRSCPGFALCKIYVQGLLSSLPRKNVEAIALELGKPPRTLQRFVESIQWEETQVRDACQRLVARDHAPAAAIGCLDDSGTAKSGTPTVGAARQGLGSRGTVDNGVVGVPLSYGAPGFQCLLASERYRPQAVANAPARRKETYLPDDVGFRTKPPSGVGLVERAWANGVRGRAWTFDEAYGRDTAFLDGLAARGPVFVGAVPTNFHGWVRKPKVLRAGPSRRRGRPKTYPRRARGKPSRAVQNRWRYSPAFRTQAWQRYRIKDTERGPVVWESKGSVCWRKGGAGLPGRRHCVLVARHVVTKEVKYFVANRVPGDRGLTLRLRLRVAFQRGSVEHCFRQAKEELGLDHYAVRGWRGVHRHCYLTQRSHWFCARMRQPCAAATNRDDPLAQLTTAPVRRALNAWLAAAAGPRTKTERLEKEWSKQRYHQRRNAHAKRAHTNTQRARLKDLGSNVDRIQSCVPKATT